MHRRALRAARTSPTANVVPFASFSSRTRHAANGKPTAGTSFGKPPLAKANGRRAFNEGEQTKDLVATLDDWQKSGDKRLFKFIISPEFGDRVDLERLTCDLMARMERDLATRLEWVAVSHFNTGHPHVHVALRGRRADGSALMLGRD